MSGNWRLAMPTPEAYGMDKVLYDIHHKPADLERYKADPDAYMANAQLREPMKAAIRDNDIGAMYLAGVNPYLLRAHCLGLRIPEDVFTQSLAAVAQETNHG